MPAIFPGTGGCYSWLSNLHLISWTRNGSFVPQIDKSPSKVYINLTFCSRIAHLVRPQHTTAFVLLQRTKNIDFHHRNFQFLELLTLFYANIPREENVHSAPPFWIFARRGTGITLVLNNSWEDWDLVVSSVEKWRHKSYNGVTMKLAWRNFD